MHQSTTTLDLLYVNPEASKPAEIARQLGFESDAARFTVAASIEEAAEHLSTQSVDCILCADGNSGQDCLRLVRTLRGVFPSIPVVVFTGESNPEIVDELLRSGATEIIQSAPASAPESLIRTRIEGLVTEGSIRSARERALERYERTLNTAVDPIYQLDADGSIVAVNDATIDLTGYERTELIGSHVSKVMSESDVRAGQELIRDQLQSGTDDVRRLEMDLQTSDGETVPCEARIATLVNDGEYEGSVGVVRDLRERREREAELRERDELLEHISESITDVVWISTPDKSEIEFVSAAYEDIWGRPPESLYENPQSFVDAIHPEDRERVEERLERQREDPDSYDETYRVVQPDGDVRWVRDNASGVYEDGELAHIVGVAQDITERREREQELKRTRDLLTNAERLGDVGSWEFDTETQEQYWSAGTKRIHEVDEDYKPTVEDGIEFYHPEDRDEIRELVDRCIEDGESYRAELRIITAEGNERWIETRGEPVKQDGEVRKVRGYIQDVTERRNREAELQAQHDLIQQILQTSPVGICVIDGSGDIVRVNDRATEIFGIPREEFTGRRLKDERWRLYDEDDERVSIGDLAATRVFETGEPVYDWEVQVERPSGERVWVSVNGAPIVDEDGTVSKVVLTIEDIEERKRREHKIAEQRDELAELDRLNEVIRDVDQALVGATSREEIESAVCELLTDAGHYRYTVAVRERGDGALVPHEWTEGSERFVDEVFPVQNVTERESPGLKAVETGQVQVIQSLSDSEDAGDWRDSVLAAGVRSLADVPVSYGDRSYGFIAVYSNEEAAFGERELEVLEELGETVGYAIAAVERREREQTLTALYEATRDLLGTETGGEVSDVVVDAAREVMDIPGVGVFLFDDDENVLRPAATTDTLRAYYGDSAVFGPGTTDSETWQAYVTGETRVFDDIRESERLVNADTDARSVLAMPLGDHGVFVAAAPEIGIFDDRTQQLVGLLAATTEAALDRVAGQVGIRERDAELAARTEQVEKLERIVGFVRDIDQLLIRAGTRAEIEQDVCSRLTEMEPYTFAWIGTVPPDSEGIEPQTWAGSENGYLDDVSLLLGDTEPAAETATKRAVTTVQNVTEYLRESPWARAAIDRGFQSVTSVPLVYGETSYGVLTVYANEPQAFDETVSAVLRELGETVAYSINTVETRRGILSDQVTELELHIEGPETFLNAVATRAGEAVTYREIQPEGGGTARVLFALSDPPVEEILGLESEFVAVESLSHVEQGDEHLFRATLGGRTVAATILKCGGIPHKVVASPDETNVTVRLPQELDVRVFLGRVRETYPETELVSRRDVEHRAQDRADVQAALEKELTERQREVLLTAYESGFFESPRETTGAELAELLGVSQPTVTHHLREAQRRLFATLYGDEDAD